VRELIWELLELAITDRLPPRVFRHLQSVVQLLQCYLRAAELEMRVAEEHLQADLDVQGLRTQILERVEELEAREREREDVVAQVVEMAEEHGLDAGVLKAVIGR
jgi:uncharacterized protein (UPF0335 family)